MTAQAEHLIDMDAMLALARRAVVPNTSVSSSALLLSPPALVREPFLTRRGRN